MRISQKTANQASEIIHAMFGPDAKIWLFGSRANDAERGGDVDIFVETISSDALKRIDCRAKLTDLFDFKVDLIIGGGDLPIHKIAKSTGVRLN